MGRMNEIEVFDARGRLIVTPHALTLEGQSNVPAELVSGENLLTFLERHVPSLHSGAWSVYINNVQVPQAQWRHVKPKHGTVIAVRSVVQRQVLALVATVVLAYFTMGAGLAALGAVTGLAGTALTVAGAALFVGGSLLINKVLGPKMPGASGAANNADSVYSLGAARNQVRRYEPIPLVLGINFKYAPDYASVPYTWFEGNDQYLATILNLGINVGEYLPAFFRNGETAMGEYESVSIYNAGFASMPEDQIPLHSNPDSANGAELEVPEGSAGRNPALSDVYGAWIQRTSSSNTVELQVDIEASLYDVAPNQTVTGPNSVNVQIEYAPISSGNWVQWGTERLTHSKTSPFRRTISIPVDRGQYDVRVRASTAQWDDDGDQHTINWTQLKSIQLDEADYSGLARIGLKIKATGQLNGALDVY